MAFAIPVATAVPAVEVSGLPDTDIFWSVVTVSVPADDVRPIPVTDTGACWDQAHLSGCRVRRRWRAVQVNESIRSTMCYKSQRKRIGGT